jgi:hypothetical protein
LLAPDDPAGACARLEEALALATEQGMRPLAAHCHLGLGRLYGRVGKRPQADEEIATALEMFREMDMRFWLAEAETTMRRPR